MSNKVVIVTGGTRGVGLGITKGFLDDGASVVVCGRNAPEEPIEVGSRSATFISGDVRDVDQISEALQLKSYSYLRMAQLVIPHMQDNGWGRIVNLSSAASLHPPGPLNSAYATSKVALNHFTRHLATELEGTGVTTNVIHPGDVKTAMWADIRDKAGALSGEQDLENWVAWVEETGGDPPEKAAKLVLDIIEVSLLRGVWQRLGRGATGHSGTAERCR